MRLSRVLDRTRGGSEAGFSILEVVLALTLFAVAVLGIGVSAGFGLRLTGQSNSRQAAVQVATDAMETLRASEWTTLGMDVDAATFTEATDPGSPDGGVNLAAKTYAVPLDNPVTEDLVDIGTTPHRLSTAFDAREFDVYQFVTWVDETKDEKRATIVVRYKGIDKSGAPNEVVLSSIFTPGDIGFRAVSSTTPTTSGGSSTTTSSTTTTVAGACPSGNDSGAPSSVSASILSGVGSDGVRYVTSDSVVVSVSANDPCQPMTAAVTEGSTTLESDFSDSPHSVPFGLSAGDGSKTVTVTVSDFHGNLASPVTDTVTLDSTAPGAVDDLTGTAAKSSNDRTVTLRWANDVTDPVPGTTTGATRSVARYEVYVATGSSSTASLAGSVTANTTTCPAGTCSFTHANLSNQTYTYFLKAIDPAGNAGSASNKVSCQFPSGNTSQACVAVAS